MLSLIQTRKGSLVHEPKHAHKTRDCSQASDDLAILRGALLPESHDIRAELTVENLKCFRLHWFA